MKNKDLVINRNPKSLFAESIRSIRTNLAFSSPDKEVKIIINTSPEAGDGKSFVTANLAIAYAQEGKKVLLIDADLRKGRQHKIFNIKNDRSKGYSNLILSSKDERTINSYITHTEIENLDLLPTGAMPPNSSELLASINNEELMMKLRKMYDIIILDCAPVLGLNDTLVMTKLSDINVVVVTKRKTKLELIDSLPQEEGIAFVNWEDENIRNSKISKNMVKFGLSKEADYYAENI